MKKLWSRRELSKLVVGAAAVSMASTRSWPESRATVSPSDKAPFPPGFVWGTATSAYQVEGAVNEDGRGVSIWDTFAHTAGKIRGGATGDIADDFYHRYVGDIKLMAELGVKAFRFSIAWPRVFPQGSGAANPKGLDFYKRMILELQRHGIVPYVTLYHWDLPQALQDRGGWENRDTAYRLAEYAGYVSRELGAAGVRHFFTTNEIRSFITSGYERGRDAPGLNLSPKRLAQAKHYAVLGHGLSVQAIRAHSPAGTLVGLAENPTASTPVTESDRDINAARIAMREENAAYLTVILEGRYTPRYLQDLGANAPQFTDAELKIIHSPVDLVGLNIYGPQYVRASDAVAEYEVLQQPATFPHMQSEWLSIGPECLRWTPLLVNDLWKPKAIFITENGCSSDDAPNQSGEIIDLARGMYLRNCIAQLQRAIAAGAPVKGYFVWSLLDNFEWPSGFSERFGIVYVDFANLQRKPKLSFSLYQSIIAKNAI
jgi:beta-glucosidase